MALTDSDQGTRLARAGAAARLRAWMTDASHSALAQRVAGAAFLIRVASAGIAYLSQVLLARWMGAHEFGVYVYVWTWVLLVGGLFDLGLAQSAQRFIPEYASRGRPDLLRGFFAGSRRIAAGVATLAAIASALAVWVASPYLAHYLVLPLFLACLCLPAYALSNVQDGIGRSYNWLHLGMAPPYILRPMLMLLLMLAAYAGGLPLDARSAMLAAVGATWATAMAQLLALNRRLRREVPAGETVYEARSWLATSIPIFLVEGFYLLLTYTDILVLLAFRSPQDIAVYYAAAKTLALVAFVSFSVSAAVAHRFTEYHIAGDKERLAQFVADSIRWTFWPSLAGTLLILALGLPFLMLFGAEFTAGYPLMFILAVGLLARAAIGPVERLLNMVGQQNVCAMVYALAFVLNLGGCLLLVPRWGGAGAALATSAALVIESVLLFIVTKRRLGIHVFVLPRKADG